MDPNENLKQQLELASLILADEADTSVFISRADDLAYLVVSLNAWIRDGGALPDLWLQKKKGDG
jgi:hypothetical protein